MKSILRVCIYNTMMVENNAIMFKVSTLTAMHCTAASSYWMSMNSHAGCRAACRHNRTVQLNFSYLCISKDFCGPLTFTHYDTLAADTVERIGCHETSAKRRMTRHYHQTCIAHGFSRAGDMRQLTLDNFVMLLNIQKLLLPLHKFD